MMLLVRVLLTALVALAASAQDAGRLSGSIIDASGSPVPNARVLIFLPGGASPVLSGATTPAGLFHFASVHPGYYDLTAEASGFQKLNLRAVKIDPGRETSLPPLSLEIGTVAESIDVKATPEAVQTSNAEISTTVTNEQLRRLPLFDRGAMNLIYTQPGVAVTGEATTINGLRTSYANITLDGINIQDNAVRSNSLDFQPNRLFTDQVSEITVLTSNANTAVGGGAAQITAVTPSGSNEYHGSLFWFNRNNALSANTWFNNKDGLERPFLNQNQGGGSLGGPVIRDKLLFYVNYEGLRLRQQETANRTIPTANARNGIFTYQVASGEVRRANVLQLANMSIDPVIRQLLDQVPGPDRINNFRAGDSREALSRNTGGYSFLIRNNLTRDNVTGKLDYILSTRHALSGTFVWNRDILDRPDLTNDYSTVPKMTNDDVTKLLSLAWRWNPTPRFTNELRGGFNIAPGNFVNTEPLPAFFLDGLFFSNPVNTSEPEFRETNTYSLQNNASYLIGRHNFSFGFQQQNIRLGTDLPGGVVPTYTIGIGALAVRNRALTATQLPGISSLELSRANAMLASLAGYIDSYAQTFNIANRSSGFVPGASQIRHYTLDNFALYFQDAWKLQRRITLTLGVRWDYLTPMDERDGIALLPVIRDNDPIQTLLSNATLDFAGSAVGRPWYRKDRNNFAPHIAAAWDLFGNGRTSLRAGYSVSYVNDDLMTAFNNVVNSSNRGLTADLNRVELDARASSLPRIPAPVFKVPRTTSDNYDLDVFNAQALIDPGLVTPYIQQYTFGVQHEWKGTVFEARYVGNHATKALRSFDYNQVLIRENGFLDDFKKAQNNLRLALQRGIANAAYNPNIPGSQPLSVFPRLELGGVLNHPIILGLIESGQAGELAVTYQVNELNGPVNFFRNRFALGTNMMTNYSNSTYNAFVFEARRRFTRGLFFQGSYVFSKVLSDSAGVSQFRFEPFLDINNAAVERARAPFDLTHQIKTNWSYDLPFGSGHRMNVRRLGMLIGGWSINGILSRQSGTAFSIVSGRGTINRAGRSGGNTAITTLNKGQLDELFQFRMTGNGPYFVAASAIGPDGRAVAPDGAAPFQGQVFFHPGAGEIGSLQRRMFSGPWVFDWDAGIQKDTRIKERHLIQLRMEAFSVLNHPTWYIGGYNIDSSQFGRIEDNFTARRVIQFGLYYRF